LSVAVLERSPYQGLKVGETLPPEVRRLLEPLGLWEHFLDDAHVRSPGTISVWGSEQLFDKDLIFNPYGSGWHVDRNRFDRMLAGSAVAAGSKVFLRTVVRSCDRTPDGGWRITAYVADTPRELRCRAVVVAAGRSGCGFAQIGQRTHLDRLVGVVGLFRDPKDGDARTLVEACETGWWYCALLPNSRQIAAFMTDGDLIPTTLGRLQETWRAALNQSIHARARIGRKTPLGPLRIVPANTYRRTRFAGDRWLAAGDAAFTYDPLSSQGIYKAIASGVAAADAVAASMTGMQGASLDYARHAEASFARYLQNRTHYYKRETRWPKSVFWLRRQTRQSN
jgi:flavin-dependent dehydrogenase